VLFIPSTKHLQPVCGDFNYCAIYLSCVYVDRLLHVFSDSNSASKAKRDLFNAKSSKTDSTKQPPTTPKKQSVCTPKKSSSARKGQCNTCCTGLRLYHSLLRHYFAGDCISNYVMTSIFMYVTMARSFVFWLYHYTFVFRNQDLCSWDTQSQAEKSVSLQTGAGCETL
jgi:hypothetical protein